MIGRDFNRLWGVYVTDRASAAIMSPNAARPAVPFFGKKLHGFPGEDRVRIIGVLVLAFPLAGCGIAEKIAARNEYQQSADSYKQCMAANPTAPQQCEALRVSMESVERKRDGISTDIERIVKPGSPPPDYANSQ
jgi:hypothetical protein